MPATAPTLSLEVQGMLRGRVPLCPTLSLEVQGMLRDSVFRRSFVWS
jgi:hypothetical protein